MDRMRMAERFRKLDLRQRMNREKWLKGIKLTAAAILAMIAANLLGLKFAATAGIITILSIQNTKKETLRVACRRGLAFLCALGIAAAAFSVLDFTVFAFALYLFFFSCICLCFGWTEAIAMDSVLITHFLTEENMGTALMVNEISLFLIGTGMGILANLHLHQETDLYKRLQHEADWRMRTALKQMETLLLAGGKKEAVSCGRAEAELYENAAGAGGKAARAGGNAAGADGKALEQKAKECLEELEKALSALQECAYRNWNNSFFQTSVYETEYAVMRSRQAEVLHHIYASVKMTESMPRQAGQVAALIGRIEAEYDRDNTVEALQQALGELFAEMRGDALPRTREEFEARAVLFYLLKQLEEFLQLKRDFMETVEKQHKKVLFSNAER